jgi:anti-sigma B factor antagonist
MTAVTEPVSSARVLVVLDGELDIATAERTGEALDAALQRAVRLVVDLRRVTFMDCAGLAPLVRALRRARRGGGGITVLVTGPRLPRLLDATGLRPWFTVVDTPAPGGLPAAVSG